MAKAQWVKWKDAGGPRVVGENTFKPSQPWGPWTKVLGVVARCEGAHDTVVMYDQTGVTWGFMQWTFTSGRLQKLLESFKSLPAPFSRGTHRTLFDSACCTLYRGGDFKQAFERFNFRISSGKFQTLKGENLDPANPTSKGRIVQICMGAGTPAPNRAALELADFFHNLGNQDGVPEAQIAFAKTELARQMDFSRAPLGGKSIRALLNADDPRAWESPLVALFFNLWQNNPAAAYRLFLKAGDASDPEAYFLKAWELTNRSQFGRWGWKNDPKSPRCLRIAQAIKEFYNIDLQFYK